MQVINLMYSVCIMCHIVCNLFYAGQILRQFEKRYAEVIRNRNSVTLQITKCTTIGPPRNGKTCLKYLLTGQKWDKKAGTASTDVMETPQWVECYRLGDEEGSDDLWKLVSEEEQRGEVIRAVDTLPELRSEPSASAHMDVLSDSISHSEAEELGSLYEEQQEEEEASHNDTLSNEINPNPSRATAQSHASLSSDVLPVTAPKVFPEAPTIEKGAMTVEGAFGQEELQKCLNDKGKVFGDTRRIHFIDTGGQAIYHDVHPVLITSPSVYLVVFSLKDLYQKSDEEQLMYFRSDLIQRPLRSIYTFGMKTPREEDYLKLHSEEPKILIVGTHLDQIPLEESGVTQEQFLQKLSEVIKKEIRSKPYRQFVRFDTNDQSFWAVDNTQAGREQDNKTQKYIATLRGMVQNRSQEMSVKVPLPWMLLKMVMDGKRVRYCTYSELMKEALSRCYVSTHSPDADLDTMLWLFHTLGLIYHKVPTGYTKEDSLVFINPDCLYSATSDFLMAAKEEIEERSRDHHQTQSSTLDDGEVAGKENGQQLNGIVHKKAVLERVHSYSESIQLEMEGVLKIVEEEALLGSLLTKLKEIEQQYMSAPRESKDASTMKDKQQLFIGRLVHGLVSTVERLLDASGRKEDADVKELKKVMDKAVEDVKMQCKSRSIAFHMDQFLSLLSDLRIVAKLNDSDSYVVPAALPEVRDTAKILAGTASVLVTVVSQTIMHMCYLPSGLFCSLISELVSGLGWTVIPMGRTHIAFEHKELTGKVHIIEHEACIEIKMESKASLEELTPTCQTVRKSVHKHIVCVYGDVYSEPTADSTFAESLVWGFWCEHCKDETHIAALQEDDDEYYAECMLQGSDAVQAVTPEQMVWVSGSDGDNS